MRIKITADSTCDLTPELIEQHDIGIVPLYIVKDDVAYKDLYEITAQDIFDYVESGAGMTHSSAVNVADYSDIFQGYLAEYDAIIHINISTGFSVCNQNAIIAASELQNVYVVDSRNLSSGIGHLVLDAAIMAERGMAPGEIVAELNNLTGKVESSFVIGTLKYLYKGGRCSGLAALGANLLRLHPCIEVINGKMEVGKKYRGNFEKTLLQYVEDRLIGRDDIDTRRIFVTRPPSMPEETADLIIEKVNSIIRFDEIIKSQAGCVISNHCGPICLGILFYRK